MTNINVLPDHLYCHKWSTPSIAKWSGGHTIFKHQRNHVYENYKKAHVHKTILLQNHNKIEIEVSVTA